MRRTTAAALALVTATMLAVAALSVPAGAATTGTSSGYDDPISKILDTITSSLARNPVAQVVDQLVSGTVGRIL